MASSTASTPSHDRACAISDNPSIGEQYAGNLREQTNVLVDNGEMSTTVASIYYAIADFCQQRNCIPGGNEKRDWFGHGEITVWFREPDGGIWMGLVDAMNVSGLDWPAIKEMFYEELAEDGYQDVADLNWPVTDDGDSNFMPVVAHSFALRCMLAGPWAKEFMDNTMNLFRHAALKSGLADAIGGAVVVADDGRAVRTDLTLGDILRGNDLADEDEARRQAMAGPEGAL